MEPEIAKEFGPTDLALVKTFDYSKIPEVLIVGNHFDKIFCSLELQPSFFERFDNRQKLFVVNLVIIFGRDIFS